MTKLARDILYDVDHIWPITRRQSAKHTIGRIRIIAFRPKAFDETTVMILEEISLLQIRPSRTIQVKFVIGMTSTMSKRVEKILAHQRSADWIENGHVPYFMMKVYSEKLSFRYSLLPVRRRRAVCYLRHRLWIRVFWPKKRGPACDRRSVHFRPRRGDRSRRIRMEKHSYK